MNVAVFGAGYVGSVSAACLAGMGHRVWLVEASEAKLRLLRRGRSSVREPLLAEEVERQVRAGTLVPVRSAREAVARSCLALVCVGTPSLPDGRSDLRQVRGVLAELAGLLGRSRRRYVIALRSTVPQPDLDAELLPALAAALRGRCGNHGVSLAVNPEFLREGTAVHDFLHPPFVVVGTEHDAAALALRRLYRRVEAPVHVVSPGSAALLKYACNAFHALKVSFANEIAELSGVFRADARQVMEIFCQDRLLNLSSAYLRPGFAYGGSCLPKDLRALERLASIEGIACPVLRAPQKSNAALVDRAVECIARLGARRVALLGLTFKAGTDDFRGSPLVELAERLLGRGHRLTIFDPDVELARVHGQNLRYVQARLRHLAQLLSRDLGAALDGAELVVVGKPVAPPAAWPASLPRRAWVLDLTRTLPPHPGRRIFHLERPPDAFSDRLRPASRAAV